MLGGVNVNSVKETANFEILANIQLFLQTQKIRTWLLCLGMGQSLFSHFFEENSLADMTSSIFRSSIYTKKLYSA